MLPVYRTLKPVADVVEAALLLMMLLPVMLLLALIIAVQHRGNPFFIQQRVGRRGNPFYIIKFKTFSDAPGDRREPLLMTHRLTLFSKFIRDASLDELPQLINVLKGDMALVGPRPLVSEELAQCTPGQLRRHAVLPGITGWAQVNGRNSLRAEEKFTFDVWYVDHISFMLDCRILLMTVRGGISRGRVEPRNRTTAP